MTVVESLVQVTVVAGPPVEIQVRVNWEAWSDSTTLVILPDIVISPVKTIVMKNNYPANNNLDCFHISLQRLIPSLSYCDDHEPYLYQYCNDKHQMVSQHCFYDVEKLSPQDSKISQQSSSIREIPVSMMVTLSTTTTCAQVSNTLNTVTTTGITPHETDVYIGMVGQSLTTEGDIGKDLRVD